MEHGKDDEKKSEDVEKSDEYSDVISSEYLDWMESTLKSAGVDVEGVLHDARLAAQEHHVEGGVAAGRDHLQGN